MVRWRYSTRVGLVCGVAALCGIAALAAQRPHRVEDLPRVPLNYRIDLNQADAATLALLPRIGPALAEAIVVHRERIGGFRNVEELEDVRRIGPVTRAAVEPWVVTGPPAGPPPRDNL